MTAAQRLLLSTTETATATVRAVEAAEMVRQLLAGVVAPVVTPLPYYVVIDGEQLHSVHATHDQAVQHAAPGMEIRPMVHTRSDAREAAV